MISQDKISQDKVQGATSQDKVQAKLLKGFRDFHPPQQETRIQYMQALQTTFAQFGFQPIDTPTLEYEDILLGKGGGETDKQVYRFLDLGKRKVALRFDLTVPFARYVAMNLQDLTLPFSRYQIGKVFRGENTQQGRYREFLQCDFDIIGVDSLSADLSILELIVASFEALDIKGFRIHVSHRNIISSLLSSLKEEEKIFLSRSLDKLNKVGLQSVQQSIRGRLSPELYDTVMVCIQKEESNQKTAEKVRRLLGADHPTTRYMFDLLACLETLGIAEHFLFDTSITRGLDYYTGLVFETFLTEQQDIGSVCSGGRYNNLTALYSKQSAPGVGASIGLDRLLAACQPTATTNPKTLVVIFPLYAQSLAYCHTIMRKLHQHNHSAEVFSSPKGDKTTLKDFFKYTDKVEPHYSIVIGSEELENNTISIKNLKNKNYAQNISLTAGLEFIHEQKRI